MIIYVIPFIDRSMSARDLTPSTKIECSLMLVDVSGFTQLLYHAGYKDELMHIVALAMKRFFQDAASAAQATKDVEIFNTTGDGFLAFATGRTPSRTALHFVEAIRSNFDGHVKSLIRSVPFRQRVDLRIALHHGSVHRIDVKGLTRDDHPVYIGDDINLIARVINSQVARRHGIAITRGFYRRLMLTKGEPPMADEVILDRNRYPEQIEVYRMPVAIPALRR